MLRSNKLHEILVMQALYSIIVLNLAFLILSTSRVSLAELFLVTAGALTLPLLGTAAHVFVVSHY